jgi:hypothetical protein
VNKNHTEYVKRIESIEKSIIASIKRMIQSDDALYLTDCLIIAVSSRTLKQSRGFRTLIESANYECAITALRSQVDTAMRFFGASLYQGSLEEYTRIFLNPKIKTSSLFAKDGKKMFDVYLIEQLDIIYPGIKDVYKYSCQYSHFTEMHFARAFQIYEHKNDNRHIKFEASISSLDTFVNESEYIDALNCFLSISEVMLNEINKFITSRLDKSIRVPTI